MDQAESRSFRLVTGSEPDTAPQPSGHEQAGSETAGQPPAPADPAPEADGPDPDGGEWVPV